MLTMPKLQGHSMERLEDELKSIRDEAVKSEGEGVKKSKEELKAIREELKAIQKQGQKTDDETGRPKLTKAFVEEIDKRFEDVENHTE